MKTPNLKFTTLALLLIFMLVIGLIMTVLVVKIREPQVLADSEATLTPTCDTDCSVKATPFPYDATRYAQRQATLTVYSTAAGPATYVLFYMEETRLASEYLGTPSPTPEEYVAGSGVCAYSWARKPLPDITSMAQIALNLQGINDKTVRVEAYGESCYDQQTMTGSFAAMSTDFYITSSVNDLTDSANLVQTYLSIYQALDIGLTVTALPAPPGYLDVMFTTGEGQTHLRASFGAVRSALAQGLTGEALFKALGGS